MNNKAASIRAKLLNLAKSENIAFQVIIFRYLHERLLYRLSKSAYKKNFFLKGGALLYAFENELTRPTKDVDFLGSGINNDLNEIKQIFIQICHVQDDDAVWFDADKIDVEVIKEEDKYEGVRLFIHCGFDSIRQRIQIDVGFGDVIVSESNLLEYPVLLEESNPIIINAYSKESVISEKFHAMVALSFANSRMKDFYDVYYLLQSREINLDILHESILATFRNRETNLNDSHFFFEKSFAQDDRLNSQWKLFLKKNKLIADTEFMTIVEYITEKLSFVSKEIDPLE